MRLLRQIERRLLLRPWKVLIHDDQRAWRAITLLMAAWHLAREIDQRTRRSAVGIMLPTSGLFPAAVLASWMTGRVIVPLNYLLSPDDLQYVATDSGLDTVVTVQPMLDFIGGLPTGVTPLLMEKVNYKGLPRPRLGPSRGDDELACLLYTSGTSARPKGVMLSAGNLASNVSQCVEWAKFDSRDVVLGVLPQFHSFGLTVLTLLPLAVGGTAVYTAKFVPKRILELAGQHRPTALVAIPSMYNALRLLKSGTAADFASLRYCVSGGEPLPQAVMEGFRERFGITICEGYGLTETSPVTNWCRPDEYRWRSVGRPLPGVEQRIVGPQDEVLPAGEDGEVRIKGPNVMLGYHNLPEQTRDAFDSEGYFRTGDMGRFDDDGHLRITGRIKEMLIIAGENVFPREIEEVLNRHDAVKDSAVIGMPDGSRGEVALAFVELKEGMQATEHELRAHCRTQLAQFKVPREVRVLSALPRNATGKIVRRQLSPATAAPQER
ncbi:MAG: AMP-binding protein [Phycisphaeraceae bacterium]|nr:AMP-binding protein [Phycisphaeraceae bacterium]